MYIMEGSIVNIVNKLFEYSNQYIDIRIDINLPMPGFSTIEKNIYGRFVPIILLNPKVLQEDTNVQAHILGHEWGHHVCKHIGLVPPLIKETEEQKQRKEDEADLYAAKFIKEYMYDKKPILEFLKSNPIDYDNRSLILNSQK